MRNSFNAIPGAKPVCFEAFKIYVYKVFASLANLFSSVDALVHETGSRCNTYVLVVIVSACSFRYVSVSWCVILTSLVEIIEKSDTRNFQSNSRMEDLSGFKYWQIFHSFFSFLYLVFVIYQLFFIILKILYLICGK